MENASLRYSLYFQKSKKWALKSNFKHGEMRIINAVCQNEFLLRLHQYQKMGNSSQNCFWENKEGSESMVRGNDYHENKINAGTWQLFLLLTAKFPPSSSGDDDFFHEGRYFKNINCPCKSMVILANLYSDTKCLLRAKRPKQIAPTPTQRNATGLCFLTPLKLIWTFFFLK